MYQVVCVYGCVSMYTCLWTYMNMITCFRTPTHSCISAYALHTSGLIVEQFVRIWVWAVYVPASHGKDKALPWVCLTDTEYSSRKYCHVRIDRSHSKHCFPAPSSKLCQIWLHHWRGTLYLRAAVHQRGQHPLKGLGTNKTVDTT